MWLKIVRIRRNGEKVIDEGGGFKDDLNEVKRALNKYTPSVYPAYYICDKQGNVIASNGLFGSN